MEGDVEARSTLFTAEEQQVLAKLPRLREEIHRVIVGQEEVVTRLLVALLCGGHVLLEGVPGLAKTLMIRTLAQALNLQFSRIQFTPDLLPADITGTLIYNQHTGKFDVRLGPIFANLVLADEVNRAPPRVQSALLEAMQELQVTIGDETYRLPEPFFVMATQNPLEQEGTYPLPEAQVDRFLMKVLVHYPGRNAERQILRMHMQEVFPQARPVLSGEDLLHLRRFVYRVYMDARVEDYILDIVEATRSPEKVFPEARRWIAWGASPRGTIALARASCAHALLEGRHFVTPDDVRAVAPDILRHRIGLTYEAEAEAITPDHVLSELLRRIEVP